MSDLSVHGNSESADLGTSRREFLKASAAAGAGLVIAFYVAPARQMAWAQGPVASPKVYPPNAFVRIAPDNSILIQVSKIDIGQGVLTALPMLLAEELDCAWQDVRAELGKADDAFRDPLYGIQMVGSSTSVNHCYQQYREIGARARAMLVQAAATKWNVGAEQCKTAEGFISGPAGQRTSYGAVAEEAMLLQVPSTVKLKDPKDFKIIGKATQRLDTADKSTGRQRFAIDMDMAGMKVALVARAPTWGAKVLTLDDSAAKARRGVSNIFRIPGDRGGDSVVVVADGYWIAKRARDAMKIDWDYAGVERVDTETLMERYKALAQTPGTPAERADTSGLKSASKRIDAVYEFPYLAHVPMEPLNMTLLFTGDSCKVWAGSQFQTLDRAAIAKVLDLQESKVEFITMMAGGGFGRRAVANSPNAMEAAYIAKELRNTPVKVMWTREDDIRGGYYRPMHVHRVQVGYRPDGRIIAWEHVVVGQSILAGSPFEEMMVKDGVDATMVEGVRESQYAIPNLALSVHNVKANVPVLWYRSVGHTHTAYVMETLIDEIARSVNRDPVEYRRTLFGKDAQRSRQALDLAVAKSGYGRRTLPKGRAFGVAVHHSFQTSIAYVAEVSIDEGRPKVHRVTAGVHCNMPVNPRTIEAQVQGGAVFGMSSMLPGFAITLKDGKVQQSNFTNYTPPYMADAPIIDVHIVPSTDPPTGIGEPPATAISPAIANAVAALTGQRIRKLPIENGPLRQRNA